ncbi:flagellar FlbD family protein [Spongisporangium articulatum]|uniref:Flagellar FlbD family protein n=1 Tax=Spongisporangium articulatum TaxID=3362603 RepID=A0ABW8AIP9_9ACTN
MITLTRLGAGQAIAVNPDLIERIEATPDTVVTLVDGHKLVVEEPLDDVIERVRTWRASVAAQAVQIFRQTEFDDDSLTEHDMSEVALADKAGAHAQVGRVLRMPTREV